jgi:hypothetical protein
MVKYYLGNGYVTVQINMFIHSVPQYTVLLFALNITMPHKS